MTRRDFLKKGVAAAAAIAFPNIILASSAISRSQKRLSLYNIHTGESLRAVFWAEGEYVDEGIAELNHLLRDFRTGDVKQIDLDLYNLLHDLQSALGAEGKTFHLISGYRSPHTNEYLQKHTQGVAKHSLHMDGKASDIRLPGVELAHLRNTALHLRRGGVGFYPKSNFVHLDTGRVRHW
ncbi:DUF882 domain-containing protein [Hydrogenimonas sp.]